MADVGNEAQISQEITNQIETQTDTSRTDIEVVTKITPTLPRPCPLPDEEQTLQSLRECRQQVFNEPGSGWTGCASPQYSRVASRPRGPLGIGAPLGPWCPRGMRGPCPGPRTGAPKGVPGSGIPFRARVPLPGRPGGIPGEGAACETWSPDRELG